MIKKMSDETLILNLELRMFVSQLLTPGLDFDLVEGLLLDPNPIGLIEANPGQISMYHSQQTNKSGFFVLLHNWLGSQVMWESNFH